MRKTLLLASSLLLTAPVLAEQVKPAPSPPEIVAAAPKSDWTAIPASDLLVMDLAPDAKGKPRRVVIQLMPPPFSQGWIGNIRTLAKAHWWDGLSVNRVQDNYVVQWGDADGEDAKKAKALPGGLAVVPESDYESSLGIALEAGPNREALEAVVTKDAYAPDVFWSDGFAFGLREPNTAWPVHCYGMVGVGRDMPPNTGSGAELYVVIGHAPRHLDRNIALVGRVIEGIEHLSSLPRGKGPLGFYDLKQGDRRVRIRAIRLGSEVPGLSAYEYLSTESPSFAAYADARANRRDPFFIRPAGGADICNIPVPVRRVK